MDQVSRVHPVCTVRHWVQVQDHIIHYLAILIKARHLVINKDHGMDRVQMDLQDLLEDPVDLEVRLSKVHLDRVPASIDLLECNFMVVRLDHPVRDLHVAHLDILVDLQGIPEEHNLVPNGTDRQECIMGLRDHQVSLNINICKGRSLAKAHHREDLLQVLWVVQAGHLRDTVDRRKVLLKVHQVARHLMSILHSFHKDRLINILGNIHRDLLVRLMVRHMGRLMVLLMVLLTVLLMDNHMDRHMYRHMATDHQVHKPLTEHPDLIIAQKVHRHLLSKNSKR